MAPRAGREPATRLGIEPSRSWRLEEDSNLANLSFINKTDTTLGGLPAKRWTRYAYDVIHAEIAVVDEDRVFLLSAIVDHEEHPEFEAHRVIYDRIIESFTLTGQ